MEKFVCHLIVTGVIPNVKIHRPQQIIYFKAAKVSIDTLDQWGSNVRKLTDILNKVRINFLDSFYYLTLYFF